MHAQDSVPRGTYSTGLVTIWVNGFCKVKGIGSSQIRVGWGDSQNETSLLADELHDHVSDLGLDVCWLIANRNLGESRKVNQGDVKHCSVAKAGLRSKTEKREKEELKISS